MKHNENVLNGNGSWTRKKNKIFTQKQRVGKSVVYVGSKTGRDGVLGASMASAEFDENSEEKPAVPLGDPFTEN